MRQIRCVAGELLSSEHANNLGWSVPDHRNFDFRRELDVFAPKPDTKHAYDPAILDLPLLKEIQVIVLHLRH